MVFAAPMAGYSDSIYRRFARKFGADLVFTEMVSAEGFCYSTKRTLDLLKFTPAEKPIGVQFFTGNPEMMAEAARMVGDMGFAALDLNFGCPVKKVTKRGAGSAILAEPERAIEIVEAAMESQLPVSVKIRCGVQNCDEWQKILELLKKLEFLGIAFVTIHPRSAKQMFSGQAEWTLVEEAVENLSIPVIGSGDLLTVDSIKERVQLSDAAGVAIARGAIGNFEIFAQARALFAGQSIPEFSLAQRIETMREFILEEIEFRGEYTAMKWSRKFLIKMLSGIPGASQFRKGLSTVSVFDDVEKLFADMQSAIELADDDLISER